MPVFLESGQKSKERGWIEIRLDRLHQNLEALKSHAGSGTAVMAVVKANAYGHGLVGMAQSLAPKVQYLGVASLSEALTLKENGIKAPVFLFGRLFLHELESALQAGITLSVSSFEEARDISEISENHFLRTPVHIKVDTGMGRMGTPVRHAVTEIKKIAALPGIILEGLYTHFPTAECQDGFAEKQLADFEKLIMTLDNKHIRFKYRHAANSAGTVRLHSSFLNMVRPGIMMYGLYPDPSLKENISLSPVLSLKSRLIHIKELEAGDSAGYGRTFVAAQPTRIGIVPIGYSHGYPVSASNKCECLFNGRKIRMAGRISMDYLAVDLGQEPAHPGDEITLIGEENGQTVGAEEIASWANTIPYEIVTQLAPQLPRLYQS